MSESLGAVSWIDLLGGSALHCSCFTILLSTLKDLGAHRRSDGVHGGFNGDSSATFLLQWLLGWVPARAGWALLLPATLCAAFMRFAATETGWASLLAHELVLRSSFYGVLQRGTCPRGAVCGAHNRCGGACDALC